MSTTEGINVLESSNTTEDNQPQDIETSESQDSTKPIVNESNDRQTKLEPGTNVKSDSVLQKKEQLDKKSTVVVDKQLSSNSKIVKQMPDASPTEKLIKSKNILTLFSSNNQKTCDLKDQSKQSDSQNEECVQRDGLKYFSKSKNAKNYHTRQQKHGNNIKKLIPSVYNRDIDRLIKRKQKNTEIITKTDEKSSGEKVQELDLSSVSSKDTVQKNQESDSKDAQSCKNTTPESVESIDKNKDPQPEEQSQNLKTEDKSKGLQSEGQSQSVKSKDEPLKSSSNNLNKLLFSMHKKCNDCDEKPNNIFDQFEKDKSKNVEKVEIKSDEDPFVKKLDELRIKQVEERKKNSSKAEKVDDKESIQSFPSSKASETTTGLPQNKILAAEPIVSKNKSDETTTLVEKAPRPPLGPKTTLNPRSSSSGSKEQVKQTTVDNQKLLGTSSTPKLPLGPKILPVNTTSTTTASQNQQSTVVSNPGQPQQQVRPDNFENPLNNSSSNNSDSNTDTESSLTSLDISEESTSMDGSNFFKNENEGGEGFMKPNVKFKKPPKGFNKQMNRECFEIFKSTMLKNNIVEKIDNEQDYVDAVSKFLITKLGSKDLITSVWESTWSNEFDKARRVCVETDFSPFFWFHFFSNVMLNFQIKNNMARFNKQSSCKLDNFLLYGNILKTHWCITQKFWLPLFLFNNFPAPKIREILSSKIWSEKLKIQNRAQLEGLIDFVSESKFDDENLLKHEWGNIVSQISVKVPKDFNKINKLYEEKMKLEKDQKPCCLPKDKKECAEDKVKQTICVLQSKDTEIDTKLDTKDFIKPKDCVQNQIKPKDCAQNQIKQKDCAQNQIKPKNCVQKEDILKTEQKECELKTVVEKPPTKKKISDGQCRVKNMCSHETRVRLVDGGGNMFTKCSQAEEIDSRLTEDENQRCIETARATFIDPLKPKQTKQSSVSDQSKNDTDRRSIKSTSPDMQPGTLRSAKNCFPPCSTQTITFIPQQQIIPTMTQGSMAINQQRFANGGVVGLQQSLYPQQNLTMQPTMSSITGHNQRSEVVPREQMFNPTFTSITPASLRGPRLMNQQMVENARLVQTTYQNKQSYPVNDGWTKAPNQFFGNEIENVDSISVENNNNKAENKFKQEMPKYIKTEFKQNDNKTNSIELNSKKNTIANMSDSLDLQSDDDRIAQRKLMQFSSKNLFTKELAEEAAQVGDIIQFCDLVGVKKITEVQSKSKLKFIAHVVNPEIMEEQLKNQYKNTDVLPVKNMIDYAKSERTIELQNDVKKSMDGIIPFKTMKEWQYYLKVFDMLKQKDDELRPLYGFDIVEKFYQSISENLPESLFEWSERQKLQHYLAIYIGDSSSQQWQKYWKDQWTLKPIVCDNIKKFKKENPQIPKQTQYLIVSLFPSNVEK